MKKDIDDKVAEKFKEMMGVNNEEFDDIEYDSDTDEGADPGPAL